MIKTDLPTTHGERQFAEYITNILDNDDYWFWFNVQIPKAGESKEVDALIYSKTHKIFIVIEVKGFLIEHIQLIQKGKIILNSGESRGNPWVQASENAKKFKTSLNYFQRIKQISLPNRVYFSPIVTLPFIKRDKFINNFVANIKTNTYLSEMSSSTLFEDDFINNKVLINRIEHALKYPIYGLNFYQDRNPILTNSDLERFSKILFPEIRSSYNKTYDAKIIRELERESLKILENINPTNKILIEGYAGTGKTYLGFNLARKLSSQGKRVLFTCYNKTLATDLKRIKNKEPLFRNDNKVQANLFIKDIFEILVDLDRIFPDKDNIMTTYTESINYRARENIVNIELTDNNNKDSETTEYDKWAIEIVGKILTENEMHNHLYKYDYIIADETQDFKSYMFDLLELLVKSSSNLTYIFGKKQVLYQNDELSDYNDLSELREKLKSDVKSNYIAKRRVFRTTDISFLIAQSYLNYFPRSDEAIDFISDNFKNTDDSNLQLDFEFERKGGNPPKVFFSKGEVKNLTTKLYNILEDIFKRNKDLKGVDSDVMILIPNYSYIKTPITEVLKKFNKRYIDYTLDVNKRIEFSEDEVRICSYYSSRGLEANFVLILGFNYFELPIIGRKKEYIINDLGYIILSRAIYDTYFLTISDKKERQMEFLEEIIKYFEVK